MQPSSPICSLTSRLTQKTLIERPTLRPTLVPSSSRPHSLPRLRRHRRSSSLCARGQSSRLMSGLRPVFSSCRAPYDQATPWSSRPTYGRPNHAKNSEAQGGQLPYAASTNRQPASPSMSRERATVVPMKTSYCHSTLSEWQSSNRPDFPPTSPCGNRDFGLTCRTATGTPSLRCGASCTFILSLQRHGRKKVGSLRSAICLLAADVETMGGQGGGPRRGARRHTRAVRPAGRPLRSLRPGCRTW